MPYAKSFGTTSQISFLASAKFVSFTQQISDAGVTANSDGKKLVPAGTVWPLNDATATGIVLTEVDVTNGPQPGPVMVEGYVIEARLPVAPIAAAKTALKEIKFR